jgi:hypothetical protein
MSIIVNTTVHDVSPSIAFNHYGSGLIANRRERNWKSETGSYAKFDPPTCLQAKRGSDDEASKD